MIQKKIQISAPTGAKKAAIAAKKMVAETNRAKVETAVKANAVNPMAAHRATVI